MCHSLKQHASMRAVAMLVSLVLSLVAVLGAAQAMCCGLAWAASKPVCPSVLLVDAGLGDYDAMSLRWLGDKKVDTQASGKLELRSVADPAWCAGIDEKSRPATFLLGSPKAGVSISASDVAWALDCLRESGAQAKTFVVAFGASGLAVREYAEDLADEAQSARADIVGICFCGTPHNGYSIAGSYPELPLWDTLAAAAGRSKDDLAVQSAYLSKLNSAPLPKVCKVLNITGSVGDLGFGLTDGAAVSADCLLPDTVCNQVQSVTVNATAGRNVDLTGAWTPATSSIDYPGRSVDAQLAERLAAMDSYELSEEVSTAIADCYQSWFSGVDPVTHSSNVVLVDLSGSMNEQIDGSTDKLSAAKLAAREYLHAMRMYAQLPLSAPADVAIYGFNTRVDELAVGYGEDSSSALDQAQARGETNIEAALKRAETELKDAPVASSKRVLLLSDGASTEGANSKEMLSGVVARLGKMGAIVDTIGYGKAGESNASFLKKAAKATGGTYREAGDTFSVQVGFLKSYYESIGSLVADVGLKKGAGEKEIGEVGQDVVALQVGVLGASVAPEVALLRNGEALDASLYDVHEEDNLVSVQCMKPKPGKYTVKVSGEKAKAHVFAVQQRGVSDTVAVVAEEQDYSLFFIIGAAALLAIAIVVVVVRTLGKRKAAH